MREYELEELLYQLMQKKKLSEIAPVLGYKRVSELAKALKDETIGTEDLKYLAGVLGISVDELYGNFFAGQVNPKGTKDAG